MKTILKLIYRWYRRKKELEDMQGYIWSEAFRIDGCSTSSIKSVPKMNLRMQYNLSPKWNKCDVWYCLEQFFVLRAENQKLRDELEKTKAHLSHYADLNQNP